MPDSSGTATSFGGSEADPTRTRTETLLNHVADAHYFDRVVSIAVRVPAARDQQTVHALFREGVAALGASSAMFVSFVRDDRNLAACRFMLACDPAWGRVYVQDGHFAHDPWLAYAAHHSEPVVASALKLLDDEHRRVMDLAARAGFVSTVLVPAHSAPGHSRISVLCLGSPTPGYFEGEGLPQLRVSARMLAMELHDWWLSRIRRDLIVKARITPEDLVLLQHQCQGHSSKKIAAELQVSKGSINSRFQRMNAKLGVGTRRMAAQLAIECGLILK
jgi:DNA-binding CsgD family transcriptional regulator